MRKPLLESDPWLGSLLGRETFRLALPPGSEVPADAGPVGPRGGAAVFIQAKVDVACVARARWLESLGFRLADTNVTFEKAADPDLGAPAPGIRPARPDDQDDVARVARENLVTSRFHQDPAIPRAAADRIKEEWARNFFQGGRGEAMVVAEESGSAVGFLLLLRAPDALVIDLVAVDAACRGKGLAAAMTRFAEAACGGASRLRVGTQIANAPAIRAYQGMGFRLSHSQYVFHYHGPMPPGLRSAHA